LVSDGGYSLIVSDQQGSHAFPVVHTPSHTISLQLLSALNLGQRAERGLQIQQVERMLNPLEHLAVEVDA
jgi:hypothetical protein